MDIVSRINGRKVVFIYFFQKYFVNFFLRGSFTKEKKCEDKNVEEFFKDEEEFSYIGKILEEYYEKEDYESDITYIIENFFQKEAEKIDYEYVFKIVDKFDVYREEVEKNVNNYVSSFYYKEMDLVDRVIFLLGYIEYKEMKTERKVVLNEMIELAKRYGDDSSKNLINGIGDKLIE